MFRIGQGFDIHRLVEGRKFILAGVNVQYEKGLLGHSDADCLCHSIIDALFGALALGDIGTHFPDNSPEFKDADSMVLLKNAYELVKNEGYEINNIDNTIIAQEPKMKPYIPLMIDNISKILNISKTQISIKAKTMEEQDSIGNRLAVASHSIVLLRSRNYKGE